MSAYEVVNVRTAEGWALVWVDQRSGMDYRTTWTQAEAEAHALRCGWKADKIAPTCTEVHVLRERRAIRCSRTDCPILYTPPADA